MPEAPRFPPSASRVVELLAFPGVQLLDVARPLQVFASANELSAGSGGPPYAPRVVAAGGPVVTASAGLGLMAAPLPEVMAALDTLIVAGGPGVHDAAGDPALVGWVRTRAAQARRIASVCTGAFLLGEAGLLDGRRAATHWTRCADLARRFPAIRVEADPIFVRDGPVWSSAGVTSPVIAGLAFFLLGAGPVVWVVSTTTLRQAVTPAGLLGRVSALNILAYGARPVGAALAALVGEAYGSEACLLLAAFGFLVQVLVIFGSPVPRLTQLPAALA
jgi:putative intracellular protease/amidase